MKHFTNITAVNIIKRIKWIRLDFHLIYLIHLIPKGPGIPEVIFHFIFLIHLILFFYELKELNELNEWQGKLFLESRDPPELNDLCKWNENPIEFIPLNSFNWFKFELNGQPI